MNIAVLVFNFFRNDARVEKAVAAYREAGHRVKVVALDDGAAAEAARDPDVLRIELRPHRLLRDRPDAQVLQGIHARGLDPVAPDLRVERHEQPDIVAAGGQLAGQGARDVREAAGLGEGDDLGRDGADVEFHAAGILAADARW